MENGIETVMEQCPMDMGELIEQLNKQSERVIFLGDGVPVYKAMIEEKMTVPYVFAPAQMNRQRASCVAALGMKALTEGYTGAKVQPADEFVPDYLRKSQAERQREAEASLQTITAHGRKIFPQIIESCLLQELGERDKCV